MPRPPACTNHEIVHALSEAKDRIYNGHFIEGPTHPVWNDLREQLQMKMSSKSIYTYVKLNRHNCWETIGLKINDSNSTDQEHINEDIEEDNNDTRQTENLHFKLDIPIEDWRTQWTEEVEYNDKERHVRNYTILKRGAWCNALNDKIWDTTKCPCTLTFKRGKVNPESVEKCIRIFGNCVECNAMLSIWCNSIPEKGPVVLHGAIEKIKKNLHTGKAKRWLNGERRVTVSKELCEGKRLPYVWRAAEAHSRMNLGDPEPSDLPSLIVLRKAKHERGNKELPDKDPILSLQTLKHSVPHSGSIRDIGLDKFFCHYWTPSQIQVYTTMSKMPGASMCFDATGTVVKKLKRPNSYSGDIFLYQGVLFTKEVHVPVVQMLSERHNILAIAQWLNEWQASGATAPKQVVCDFSLALLGGVVKAFTPHQDLKAYLRECFHLLMGKSSPTLPPCFLRIDVAHFIKMVSRWECLRSKTKRIREFYIRAMGQLVQAATLDEARELVQSIVVVALSESEGKDNAGIPVMSETCKDKLKRRFGGQEDVYVTNTDEDVQHKEEHIEECKSEVQNWVRNICEESKLLASNDGDRDNLHFLPELVPHLIRMASYLPLWSGIMVSLFNCKDLTASSAHVEAEFKNVKKVLFKHDSLPIRIDRFVPRHLEFIEGRMKLSLANDANPERMTEVIQDSENDQPLENWRGLAIPPKKRKSYLTPCPEWLHKDSVPKRQKMQIDNLKNGNHLAHRPIKLGKTQLAVTNTCAFDAFCQCLCCAFCDSEHFSRYVEENCHNDMLNLVKLIVTKGINNNTYKERAKILAEIFHCDLMVSGTRQLNATCNVAKIITSTMRQIPALTREQICSSPFCRISTKRSWSVPLMTVDVEHLKTEGIKALQESLERGLNIESSTCFRPVDCPEICPDHLKTQNSLSEVVRCTGRVTHTYSTGAALLIETGSDSTYPLHDLPVNITLSNDIFLLRGVVAFTPGPQKNTVGHYVAYCRRPSVWERFDDLSSRVSTCSEKTKILPHVVVYTKWLK